MFYFFFATPLPFLVASTGLSDAESELGDAEGDSNDAPEDPCSRFKVTTTFMIFEKKVLERRRGAGGVRDLATVPYLIDPQSNPKLSFPPFSTRPKKMDLDQASNLQHLPVTDEIQQQLARISERKCKIESIILEAREKADFEPKTWCSEAELKDMIKDAIKEGEKAQEVPELKIFRVQLRETETINLFELTTRFAEEGSLEWKEMAFYNNAFKEYQQRKTEVLTYDAETQTPNPCYLNRLVQTKEIIKKEKASMATEWDMFDTFKKLKRKNDSENIVHSIDEKFYEAAQYCQRVLASNKFHQEQMTFMTKHQPSRFIRYSMDILWEMKKSNSGEVTCICVNPANMKIVAVGYGNRGGKGLICCWNAKNPQSPERRLEVESPITCLDFCRSKPRYLAFTTELGEVLIVDIRTHKTSIIPLFRATSRVVKEPEWAAVWIQYEEMGKITERLMTVGHSGEVLLWDPEGQNHKKLAELAYTRTPHKDVYCTRLNTGQDEAEHNFLQRQYICHTIELHPTDPRTYYITTNEGSILTCKTREVLGDMEILPAHCGPVLGMKHSPFTSLVFLSHGTDFMTKIWVKGINEPVITLRTTLLSAILCALWSPSHSCCLVILSREEFSLWDISRSILDPMNREERSEEAYFTTAAFIKNGTSLHVGMSDGTVTTYRLNDMPHPPYLQINHLHGAFTKMLSENKSLLKQIDDILGQVSKDN